MLVTNNDIEKDILENMRTSRNVVEASVVRDMMFYMREQYETKIDKISMENQILHSALDAVNIEDEEIYEEDENTGSLFEETISGNEIVDSLMTTIADMINDFDIVEDVELNNEPVATADNDFPDSFVFCEGVTDYGNDETCDGKNDCKKYIGNREEDIQELLKATADFTNLETCKALNFDLFEAK